MSNLYQTPCDEEDDDVEEFYLKDKSELEVSEKQPEVVTSMVEVPGSFYINPSVQEDCKKDLGAEKSTT